MLKDYKFIIKQIIKNKKRFLKTKLGNHVSNVGATHKSKSIEESVAYINNVFNDYFFYGKLTKTDLVDKTILEIGPGDNFGIALKFLCRGAKKVYLVDKFYSERNLKQQLNIYKELRKEMPHNEQVIFDNCIEIKENNFFLKNNRIEYVYGYGIEEANSKLPSDFFDIIISRAVIQEISNTKAVFKKMHNLLRANGFMLHKIDLRDYGTLTKFKNHPLGNLMFNNFIYKLMTSNSGLPNRKKINHYRDLLNKNSFSYNFYISHILGKEEKFFNPHKEEIKLNVDYSQEDIDYITKYRFKFAKEYRSLSDKDLLISGIFLTATK